MCRPTQLRKGPPGRRRQGLPHHRRLDRDRRGDSAAGGRRRLPRRALGALGGQASGARRRARRGRPRPRGLGRRRRLGGQRTARPRAAPARAPAVAADVGVWEDNERLAKAALDRFGRIDVVFANAGFGAQRSFTGDSPEHWREMVLTNVLGVAYTIRTTLEAVREREGHMVLTSSAAGRRAIAGSLYSATKHAVTAMGESLRQELNGTGARVTLVEPGMVDTPFFDNPGEGRLEAEDVAEIVMFAVSRPARVDVNEILVRPTAQAA